MNQRGVWQLILMAREGDRQAIDELFYASFRPAYLVLLTLTGDRQMALDILQEGFLHIIEHLDEVENAEMFPSELHRYMIRRALEETGKGQKLSLPADNAALAQAFLQSPPCIHDFETRKSLDLSAEADKVLSQFRTLSKPAQVCVYLYYYADVTPEQIADIMGCETDVVFGTLEMARRTVLPQIEAVIAKNDAFRGIDAESTLPWALRSTARFSVLPARLESYYQEIVDKLVEAELMDTALIEETDLSETEIPIHDMQPIQENKVLRQIFSLRTLIVLLLVLAIIAGAYGLKLLRAYHARRSGWNDFTERTTLSMTQKATNREHYIFSTEYEPPTETIEETTEEASTAEATELPTEPETTAGNPERTEAVITTAKPGADFAYTVNGNQVTITGYNGMHATVEIPSKIDDRNVTAIGDNAFFNSSLTSIKMPGTIRSIGKNAFHSCTGLQSITIPSGVTSIDSNAFRGCTNLRTITLPNTLSKMGEQVFYRCTSLSSITLPSSLTSIGDWAFAYCTNLADISIPENVTTMGNSVFYECKSLARCTFSTKSKLSSLGDSTFFDCTSLTGFTFPSAVKIVPANCFVGCRSMTSVSMSTNTTSIGSNAFKDCISIASVKLPTHLTKIESAAFQGCTSLQTLYFPSGLQSIGDSAFRDCINLRSATIPASVKTIGSSAFSGCSSLVITCPSGSAAEKYALANDIEIYGRTPPSTEADDSSSA